MTSLPKYIVLATLIASLSAQVTITRSTNRIAVSIDGEPYADFVLPKDGGKPYVYPLRTASGVIVTRQFPMGTVTGETHDHPHHRGMFFAHGDINGVNFWATEAGTAATNKGSMVLKQIVETSSGAKAGTIKVIFEGQDPQGKPMMTETRTLIFRSSNDALRIIDCEIRIEALRPLTFKDTKEGTFGIRVADDLAEARTGKMTNAEGAETQQNVWGKRSPWVDYSGQVAGHTVGIAVLDHPSNPRHPTYWHARAYGLLAANIFGVRDFTEDKTKDGKLVLAPGKALAFRYRVIVHEGDVKAANIAALFHNYTSE